MIVRRRYRNLRAYLHNTEGMTQEMLAARVGVDRSYISHILSGRKRPSLGLAARLAKEANIPLESFLEGDNS